MTGEASWKRTVLWVVQILVFCLLGWYLWTNRHSLFEALRGIDPSYLLPMLLLSCASNLLTGMGLTAALRTAGAAATWKQGIRLHVVGRLLGVLLPHSGNVYRGVQVYRWFSLPFTEVVGVLTANTWLLSVTGFALSTVLLIIGQVSIPLLGIDCRILMIGVTAGFLLVPGILRVIGPRGDLSSGVLGKVLGRLERFSRMLHQLAYAPRLLMTFLILNVFIFGVMLLFFWYGLKSLGAQPDFWSLSLLFVFLRLASSWNVTPGNVGILEFVGGYLTNSFGLGAEYGVLLVLEFRAVVFVAVLIMSAFFGGRDVIEGWKRRSSFQPALEPEGPSDLGEEA